MKRNSDVPLPMDLREALNWFVEVMYCRFGFARCLELPEGDQPEVMAGLFPQTWNRDWFLSSSGHPTYLEDLKGDLENAGKDHDEAREALRWFVNHTRSPLINYEEKSSFWTPYLDSFYPDPEEATSRLRDYCSQLIQLNTCLVKEVGVTPGVLLPVWIDQEPHAEDGTSGRQCLPVIGVMSEDQYIADTLQAFVAWEYGVDVVVAEPPGRRRSVGFFYRALKWGRAGHHHEWKKRWAEVGDEPASQDDLVRLLDLKNREKKSKRETRESLPELSWLKDADLTFADFMRTILDEYPELGIRLKRDFSNPEKHEQIAVDPHDPPAFQKDAIDDLVRSPAFIKDASITIATGMALIEGDYRSLWRL